LWNADPSQMKVDAESQCPVEAITKQIAPRLTTTGEAIVAAIRHWRTRHVPAFFYSTVRPADFGFSLAQARPDKIKSNVAVEPAVTGDNTQTGKLKSIVYGEYIRLDSGGRSALITPQR